MKKEELRSLILESSSSLDKENVEAITNALYPLFNPVDLNGKTLVINIPIDGPIAESILIRYYAYSDFLKKMGAKSVIFLERDCKLTDLDDKDLEKTGLRRI